MARELRITVDPGATGRLLDDLSSTPGVVEVAFLQGAAVQPAGDVLLVTTTDAGARHVLRLIDEIHGDGESAAVPAFSITEPSSVKADGHHHELANESSEATWNEVEGQLRRESNPGLNFLLLMALAGGLAATGLTIDMIHVVVGAMVLAPGFEPFLRVPFALISGAHGSVGRGILTMTLGYITLAGGAAATFLVLRATGGAGDPAALPLVEFWTTVDAAALTVSVIGGVAGAVTVTAGRAEFTAGVMIALALIPSAAIAGIAAVEGDGGLFVEGAGRWALDGAMVTVTATAVIGAKQMTLHRRRTRD